jgi:hypothetical protein
LDLNEKNAGVAGTATPAAGDTANPATTAKPAAKSGNRAAKPATDKGKEVKPAKDVKPATQTSDKGIDGKDEKTEKQANAPKEPLAKDKRSKAKEIADRMNVSELHENEAGEFFTSHNLAMLSVGQDPNKLKKHTF